MKSQAGGSNPPPTTTTGLHCERTVIMDFRVNLGNGIQRRKKSEYTAPDNKRTDALNGKDVWLTDLKVVE